jgi:hypothetical protein
MSYTILYSDPSKFNSPIVVQDNTKYNSVGTGGLTLVGRNYPGYGQAVAENFIHILENSSSPVPPINPIEGQLWFDTSDPTSKKLRINDGAANTTNWRPINGLYQQATQPTQATVGDIWVDITESRLYVYNTNLEFIPIINTGTFVSTGAFPETVSATDGNTYEIIVNKINGTAVSIISSNKFTPLQAISPGIDEVQVGVTLSTENFGTLESPLNPKFYGTARQADRLLSLGGQFTDGINFLRKDVNDTINAQLRISKDTNALQIGSSPTFLLSRSASGVDASFNNEYNSFGTFTFNIKNSVGATTPLLTMGGSSRSAIISSPTNSNSTITGALQVAGGVGIGRDLFVGGTLYADNIVANGVTGSTGQILVTDGTNIYWDNFNENAFTTGGSSTGIFTITNVTTSTSPTSGALQVTGGVGIGGRVNIGSITTATSSTGALRVAGGVSIGENLYVAGEIISQKLTIELTTITTTLTITDEVFKINSNTNATSTITGALVVQGGAGIGRDVYVGGNVDVAGTINATIAGVATSATNITGGTAGSIVYQQAVGQRGFIGIGPADSFLRSNGTTATYATTATMYVDSAFRAERFRTARTITFTGDVTGSFILDGTQNTGTALTIQPNSIELGVDTVGGYISTGTTTGNGISGSAAGEGTTFNITSNATSTNDVSTIVFRNSAGSFAANNINATQFNGGAQGLTNIPGLQIDDGSIRNRALTSSTIGIGAGSAIGLSRTSISLGDAFTITNLGVQTLTGSAYLAVSASTGTITLTNNGVQTVTGSAYLAVSQSTGTVTITNNGVQTLTGSAYMAVSASTGTVTITNNGVQTLTGTAALGVSASTGTVTLTNLGVVSASGTTYLGVSASTGTVTFTNLGVQTLTGSDNLAVSQSTGTVTITNNGVRTLTGSAYIAVSTSTGTVTITNNGVQTLTGSAYMAVSASTGTITITNNGVQTISVAGALGVSASTGTVTITDLGVRSITGSAYLAASASTGTITLTNNGVQTLTGSAYLAVSASTGTVTITNNGVQTLTAGTDTSVSASTGTVTVWNNSTLQTITSRGSASSNAIQITNGTGASSVSTGALVVSGGVGVSGNIYAGGSVIVTGGATLGGTLTLDGATQNLGTTTTNSTVNIATGLTGSGSTKTVNIGTNSQAGATTVINIGSFANTSATIAGNLVVSGRIFMQDAMVLLPTTSATVATFAGTPTGSTVYFTDSVPPKIGVYGASAWRDAVGNILF